MVFASLVFLYAFLPANLVLYFAWANPTWRNAVLIVFSLFFYAWGEPVWLSLLLLSSTLDWALGLLVERWRGTARAKVALLTSVTLNLGLLATFKYAGFVVETVNGLVGTSFTAPGFALPLGISFYTFQTLSYVIDVYRGEVKAQRSWFGFLLFVSLYHQLVAGPIVRYQTIADQIAARVHTLELFASGVVRFSVGLFKKVAIANVAGELVKATIADDLGALSVFDAWFGLAMYTLQIYFDFSGYSDMAIGLGRMFGFHYLENFDHPYIARSVTDFWRRWHLSLSTFFRDYVYIPLGGKQRHPTRNLFIVWGLTGLWHGPSWNFVLWGLYYGALIALERWFLGALLSRLPRAAQHLWLLFVVMVGWALFFFTELSRLGAFFTLAFGASGAPGITDAGWTRLFGHAFWLPLALVLCLPLERWLFPKSQASTSAVGHLARGFATAGLTLLATAMLVGRSYNPFLYFRF
ncbi:MAG: MBOAT family O-acyltransferase [Myxococcaceae bacterium]|nr:MBOAT family O-acyltransferase [Myxococcaceae bacterium]